jgi:hypothetical protein
LLAGRQRALQQRSMKTAPLRHRRLCCCLRSV